MIKDFFYAAFPWVVIGLSAALFAVYAAKEKNAESKTRSARRSSTRIAKRWGWRTN